MKFVTKEQFENALSTLNTAIENGQVVFGRYDHEYLEPMTELLFSGSGTNPEIIECNKVTFRSPADSAKSKLYNLRQEIAIKKIHTSQSQKEMETLEAQEKNLQNALTALTKPKE